MPDFESISAPTPRAAPVMVLPGAILFPHALLPLYIFEPRYRQMLADCLENDRMFCIALVRPGQDESAGHASFFHTSGLGLIRACVSNPDGTLHLVLQGLRRVALVEIEREDPYRVARLRDIVHTGGDPAENAGLARRLSEACSRITSLSPDAERVQERLNEVDDPDILADVVGHTFVRDELQRQQLLQEASVKKRLELLLEILG